MANVATNLPFWQQLIQYIIIIPGLILFGPINRIYDFLMFTPYKNRFCSQKEHARKLNRVVSQVKEWNRLGRKQKMCTARPSWKTTSINKYNKNNFFQIEMNDLDKIVEINRKEMTVTVEPGIRIGQLTKILNAKGLTITVVPELETLTVGGLIGGTGCESSSHRYGPFQTGIVSMEVVMPNGEVVYCDKDNNADIGLAMCHSYCTIGFLTSCTLKMLECKRYVKLDYYLADSVDSLMEIFKPMKNYEFVEGLCFSKNKYAVIYGDFSEQTDKKIEVNHINAWNKPFYYQQVETILDIYSEGRVGVKCYSEYVPIWDYYHRHTRGIFWEVPNMLVPFVNSKLFLSLFGWIFPLNIDLFQLLLPQKIKEWQFNVQIIQDFGAPFAHAKEYLNFIHKHIKIYPLWLCPVFVDESYLQGIMTAEEFGDVFGDYLNVGMYGFSEDKKKTGDQITRLLTDFALKHHGKQAMYGESLMTKKEYEQMYPLKVYEKVRKEWKCYEAFPHVYDKVGPNKSQLK